MPCCPAWGPTPSPRRSHPWSPAMPCSAPTAPRPTPPSPPGTGSATSRSTSRPGFGCATVRCLPPPERERLPRPAEGLDGPLQRRRDAPPAELSRLATNPGAGAQPKRLENLGPGRRAADLNSQRDLSLTEGALKTDGAAPPFG